MVHSPNGTLAKWYIRQIAHKPTSVIKYQKRTYFSSSQHRSFEVGANTRQASSAPLAAEKVPRHYANAHETEIC
jgi:hypothetical protein